jgi:hypothetical protein
MIKKTLVWIVSMTIAGTFVIGIMCIFVRTVIYVASLIPSTNPYAELIQIFIMSLGLGLLFYPILVVFGMGILIFISIRHGLFGKYGLFKKL